MGSADTGDAVTGDSDTGAAVVGGAVTGDSDTGAAVAGAAVTGDLVGGMIGESVEGFPQQGPF